MIIINNKFSKTLKFLLNIQMTMVYDIIFITGEMYFDHPLSGVAILKHLLEKYGYKVGLIVQPQSEHDIKKLGKPRLFFAITTGAIDSMLRNYTPLKKPRKDDPHTKYTEYAKQIPDRAVIVYSNWVKRHFKDSIIVIGGIEASLRRFVHYDYWDNRLRKPILIDSRADILVYGNGEKQVLEIAKRIKHQGNENIYTALSGIGGTCVIAKEVPENFIVLPSYEEVINSKERFCDMQVMFSVNKNLAQKIDTRYVLQFKYPCYTSKDLDEYYELPFKRDTPKELRGFQFSVVTHRGCFGNCNFCSIALHQGAKVISRSEESILREIKELTKHEKFKGNIDDLGGPSTNMYGMDCSGCDTGNCINCAKLNRSNEKLIKLLRKARKIKGVKNIYIKSGIRHDIASDNYLEEVIKHHVFDSLRIAPEHVNIKVLKAMNKCYGNLNNFIAKFNAMKKNLNNNLKLSFYFMTAHPESSIKEAKELAQEVKKLKQQGYDIESVQVFTPTPMTVSTCMYYTGLNPWTKEKLYVPYTYREKKDQKRVVTE